MILAVGISVGSRGDARVFNRETGAPDRGIGQYADHCISRAPALRFPGVSLRSTPGYPLASLRDAGFGQTVPSTPAGVPAGSRGSGRARPVGEPVLTPGTVTRFTSQSGCLAFRRPSHFARARVTFSGGIASLNRRLPACIPPGCGFRSDRAQHPGRGASR